VTGPTGRRVDGGAASVAVRPGIPRWVRLGRLVSPSVMLHTNMARRVAAGPLASSPMRSLLGRVAVVSVAGATLAIGATGVAATSPDPSTPDEVTTDSTVDTTVPASTSVPAEGGSQGPVGNAAATSTPTTTVPDSALVDAVTSTTSTTTTTTSQPPLVIREPAATPGRGTQLQVTPTDPPPPTVPPELRLPDGSGEGRRIVYHKTRQRIWLVGDDGEVEKTHLVSGRLTWNQPSPGTYSVFSRSSYTCNIKSQNICWRYMVRFAKGPSGDNIGFHQIPTNTLTGAPVQSTSQLGTPLSGGCVRQATSDAIYVWNWAPIGTKVVVIQ